LAGTLGRGLELILEVDVAELGILDVEDRLLRRLRDRLLDRLRLGGRRNRGRILVAGRPFSIVGVLCDGQLSARSRLLAGLELGIAGPRNGAECLLLELVELRDLGAVLALQLEVLANGVVEDSHGLKGLQMPPYPGRRERALASPLAEDPLRPRDRPGSQVSSPCGATPHAG